MTEKLTFDHLLTACSAGGATALTIRTDLAPAGGEHATVAPPRYVSGGNTPTFAFETRFIDGAPVNTVILDAKQSVSNRDEMAVLQARQDEDSPAHEVLSRVPTIQVSYEGGTYTDLEVPARAYEGHFRAGTIDGTPATHHEKYLAVRNASPSNAAAVFTTSPTTALYGGWDATRKSNQARFRTAFTGEVIGVTAEQREGYATASPTRGAGRTDVISPSVKLDAKTLESIVAGQKDELSATNLGKIEAQVKKAKDKPISLAALGLGSIPPSVDQNLGGVACSRIIRTRVLSFAALRQLRFGGTAAADAAHRAVLAAYGLLASALSESELVLRANCDLVEDDAPNVVLDQRRGKKLELAPIEVEDGVALLEQALAHLKEVAGVEWNGEVLEITGNSAITASASTDEPEA
ncbi:type I-G CRISPR-associated RAMP protein Csb1/Cas7g [Rothia kristinae]|uniref:type I-G CRISPR-associated RAMP protein Csb1/Cas7g n=1 Tax=Rothia kristinae TaxID=37923 RepID=UPI00092C50D8|nr:type I-U CRISPR-associated RAMP protein Csb1/Cas7u [Rothia kristinae]WGH09292.1 type I-U CRISPR-associated RAMP protein Csb1/Cas7u [Rothia kristinae]SIM87746.1 CRISPR-associated protein GSU0053/csb1, Dpsyc system [Mycobacteroides abscessus subsp. abscessus]